MNILTPISFTIFLLFNNKNNILITALYVPSFNLFKILTNIQSDQRILNSNKLAYFKWNTSHTFTYLKRTQNTSLKTNNVPYIQALLLQV